MDIARSSHRPAFIVQAQLSAPENTVILENHVIYDEIAEISTFQKHLVVQSGRNSSKWYSSSDFMYWLGN